MTQDPPTPNPVPFPVSVRHCLLSPELTDYLAQPTPSGLLKGRLLSPRLVVGVTGPGSPLPPRRTSNLRPTPPEQPERTTPGPGETLTSLRRTRPCGSGLLKERVVVNEETFCLTTFKEPLEQPKPRTQVLEDPTCLPKPSS